MRPQQHSLSTLTAAMAPPRVDVIDSDTPATSAARKHPQPATSRDDQRGATPQQQLTVLRNAAAHALPVVLAGLCPLLLVNAFRPAAANADSLFPSLIALITGVLCAAALTPNLGGTSNGRPTQAATTSHGEPQEQVRKFVETMHWHRELSPLLADFGSLLATTFQPRTYHLYLRSADSPRLVNQLAFPRETAHQLPAIDPQSAICEFFSDAKNDALYFGDRQPAQNAAPLAELACQQLAQLPGALCVPLRLQNNTFGLLLLGESNTGRRYSAGDVQTLAEVVKPLSLMVNQIQLKTQIFKAQELDLLGRMSRGMAHDLNNLLTPVQTLLQLASEDPARGRDADLLQVAQRNVTTMGAYIKEALFLTENLRPDFQPSRLDQLLARAVEVARNSRSKPVSIVLAPPGRTLIEMDEVLIQRLVVNILSNAIDASPAHAEVSIQTRHFEQPGSAKSWVRVSISDQGEGLNEEELAQVFTPYFTTKNRGDNSRGFGLGMAICRKIIHLHGGHLSITSQCLKGSTLQIDLPVRQPGEQPPSSSTFELHPTC